MNAEKSSVRQLETANNAIRLSINENDSGEFYDREWNETIFKHSVAFRLARIEKTIDAVCSVQEILAADQSNEESSHDNSDVEYTPLSNGLRSGLRNAMDVMLFDVSTTLAEIREVSKQDTRVAQAGGK